VLVADDDPDLAFTLGTWLEADGYRVFTALDGQSALRVAARVQPNLVVLDRPIRLSPTEARLLSLLLRNAGRVLPNALLLDRAWPDGGGSTQALWEYIRRLRQKLGEAGLPPRAIRTERGIGYRLRP
jgi:DNA-binding response OmpR family regulator